MKKLLIICILVMSIFLSVGCIKSGVEGKYFNIDDKEEYLELKSDGTFFVYQKMYGGTWAGTYELDGDKIRLISPQGLADVGKIEKNKLYFDSTGKWWEKE